MTRIEIPIPQPEENLAFEFVEREDGLMEFTGEDKGAHVAAFRKVDGKAEDCLWAMASIAASFTKEYGKSEVVEFAAAVRRSPSRVWHLARTYRTFTVSKNCSREQNLSFKHHEIASAHPNPAQALEVARSGDMNAAMLQSWVSEQSLRRATKATQNAKRAVRNDFKEHLLHMDSVIREDFIRLSPNQEYARRVCGDWLREIADELRQVDLTESRERVLDAIDERGAENEKAIQQATGMAKTEVFRIVQQLVAEGLYEWIPKGGKGEAQKGSASMILHKVGELDGGAYNATRTENQYTH